MKSITSAFLLGLIFAITPSLSQAQKVLGFGVVGGATQRLGPQTPYIAAEYFKNLVIVPISQENLGDSDMAEATQELGEQLELQISINLIRIPPSKFPGDIFKANVMMGLYSADAEPQDAYMRAGEVIQSKSVNLNFKRKSLPAWESPMLAAQSGFDGFYPEGKVSIAAIVGVDGFASSEEPEEEDIQMATSPDGNIYALTMQFTGGASVASTIFLVKLIQ